MRRLAVGLENGEDLGFGNVEAKGFHGDFELMIVDLLVFVEVEEVELGKHISDCAVELLVRMSWKGMPFGKQGALTASFISSLCSSVS